MLKKDKKEKKKNNGSSPLEQLSGQILIAIVVLMIFTSAYSLFSPEKKTQTEVPVSDVAKEITLGNVTKIAVEGDQLNITLRDGKTEFAKKEPGSTVYETIQAYGVSPDRLSAVQIEVLGPSGWDFFFGLVLPYIPLIALILLFIWFLSRQVKVSSMQAFSFGQSKARMIDPNDEKQKVRFSDVAGAKEAKEELMEIVDFLKNPKKFLDIGARIPKGVILMGPPGSGKTLLARAVAGEAGVPFLYLSGSEFVEMFVGVGASRVRDLFNMAKKAAPAIIFIDEIDAVGRHRGGGVGGGNDEREQTLNQILVEMDGFEPNDKVIVMAATNRPDVLDVALLRPGRFDRRVTIDLPDINDREAILKIHGAKMPFAEDVKLRTIAERTPGFSGADLANLMNEASILAAREERTKVGQFDLIRSVEKVMLGPERKSHVLGPKEKEITAYHEMGHALIASVLEYSDPVHKVSIISRGRAAGYTLKLPLEEKRMHTKKQFMDDIAVSLGGYTAEQMIFGDVTTGASNDIAVASALARDMVTRYGMSDKVGPVDVAGDDHMLIAGGRISGTGVSENTAAIIDSEVSKIMNDAGTRAKRILAEHEKALHNMSNELTKVETIERKEFEDLLILNGIKPKKLPDNLPVSEPVVITPET
ncbi:MAG: ATP-dependent zinc metalloprotease FtsH [Candidatus Paceibacterota bacterium]|jgi:cell division protease FtsH